MQSASRWPANSAQPPSAPSRMLLRLANKGSLRNEALLTKPDTNSKHGDSDESAVGLLRRGFPSFRAQGCSSCYRPLRRVVPIALA